MRWTVLTLFLAAPGCHPTPPAEPCGTPAARSPTLPATPAAHPDEIRAVFTASGEAPYRGEPYAIKRRPQTPPASEANAEARRARREFNPHKLHPDQVIAHWVVPGETLGGNPVSVTLRWVPETGSNRGKGVLVTSEWGSPLRERTFGQSDVIEVFAVDRHGVPVDPLDGSWWCQVWRDGVRWAIVLRAPCAATQLNPPPAGRGLVEILRVADQRDEDGFWRLQLD